MLRRWKTALITLSLAGAVAGGATAIANAASGASGASGPSGSSSTQTAPSQSSPMPNNSGNCPNM